MGPRSAVFTNRLEDMRLQDLAEMDVKFLVQEVWPTISPQC